MMSRKSQKVFVIGWIILLGFSTIHVEAADFMWIASYAANEGERYQVVLDRNELLTDDWQPNSLILEARPSLDYCSYGGSTSQPVEVRGTNYPLADSVWCQAFSPHIFHTNDGGYRLYFTYGFKAGWDVTGVRRLHYQNTTDGLINFENGGLTAAQNSLNIGGSTYWSQRPFIIRMENKYRMYYAHVDTNYFVLKMRESDDNTSGFTTAVENNLGIGTLEHPVEHPFIFKRVDGGTGYRIFYTAGGYSGRKRIIHRTTSDGEKSWGEEKLVDVNLPSTYSMSWPFLYKSETTPYILFFFVDNNQFQDLAFSTSEDLETWTDYEMTGMGTSAEKRATDPFLIRLDNGDFRLYYSWGTPDPVYQNDQYYKLMALSIPAVTKPSGNFISKVYNGGTLCRWRLKGHGDVVPDGTGITYWYRTGNTADPNSGTWKAWEALGDMFFQNTQIGRYVQWKAVFSTSLEASPRLNSVVLENQIIPTSTPTSTITRTKTPTFTRTMSRTPTSTKTKTPTRTATPTLTATPTCSASRTVTLTKTNTMTVTETQTWTVTTTPENTATPTMTASPYVTKTITPTRTCTITSTRTPANTPVLQQDRRLRIYGNRVNPRKGETARICWYQPSESPVKITVYNPQGKQIICLANRGSFTEGQLHEVKWSGYTQEGEEVGSGIYIVYLETGQWKTWQKIAVIK